ncbi:MAG TPA: hypothetical protein VG308_15485 [Stellaceae bacterium]|jgi:hypothetical protein|nr:hypothetical protein [Stellaceae bacterium]
MRYLLPLIAVVLAGCAQGQSDFTRIGERSFRIESQPIPGGATGPNQRLAQQLCPAGYRVLDSKSNKGGVDRAIYDEQNTTTVWVIKCI